MSCKQIAELTNLPERTITRIINGETDAPYVSTLRSITLALGSSLDAIFAETKVVVGNQSMAELKAENDTIQAERELILTENKILKDKVNALESECSLLKLQLSHKDELLAVFNFFTKINSNK